LTDKSTNKYIDKIVDRYSQLFTLPSPRKLAIYFAVIGLHGSVLSVLAINLSFDGFLNGLLFGATFIGLTFFADLLIKAITMKTDPIFNLRRCSAMSFFSSLVWFAILLLGVVISAVLGTPNLWIRFFFLGFGGSIILRLLVYSVTSFAGFAGASFAALLQPFLCLLPLYFVTSTIGSMPQTQLLLFVFVPVSVAVVTVQIFKYFMDREGAGSLGIGSSFLFKAFLANWTEDLVAPLENYFEKMGNLEDVKVSLLTFRTKGKLKAAIIVPSVHPGPFKNLGSSLLPSLIQTAVQDKYGCVVCSPHGLVGHELDIASQVHNQRVVDSIVGFLGESTSYSKATPMVRTESQDAKASCQLFGDCAFVTLTTAPKTIEDLPPELEGFLSEEAKKRGFSVLPIDAHNSMGGEFDQKQAVSSFSEASVACFEKALKSPESSFCVGASTVVPSDFSVRDGMGPGGISVLLIEVDSQKVAYVTIDGNNMVSGLRDKILSAIKTLGIDDGEVLTTDTHSVCGLTRSARGYNLVGEAMDQTKLISYIKDAISQALSNLEPVTASWRTEKIRDVKVIGDQQITELTVLADKTTECVKRVAIVLFPSVSIILTALLLFLL
jgi:putative membrane protein